MLLCVLLDSHFVFFVVARAWSTASQRRLVPIVMLGVLVHFEVVGFATSRATQAVFSGTSDSQSFDTSCSGVYIRLSVLVLSVSVFLLSSFLVCLLVS